MLTVTCPKCDTEYNIEKLCSFSCSTCGTIIHAEYYTANTYHTMISIPNMSDRVIRSYKVATKEF